MNSTETTQATQTTAARQSAAQSRADTTVLWRGFRHAWSYNHRLNRLGSWVDHEQCGASTCQYEVGHSAASGSGEDVAAVRDAYTELSAKNVTFVAGSETVSLVGDEHKPGPASQQFQKTVSVTLNGSEHPELLGHDNYTVVVNGFDAKSRGEAAKIMKFGITVRNVRQVGNDVTFDLYYNVLLDCDSFECKGHIADPGSLDVDWSGLAVDFETRGGKKVQLVDYELEVDYLVIGGDEDAFNYVEGPRQRGEPNWDNCYNNGLGPNNSDEFFVDPLTNGHPGNHMWCESSGGFTVQHENFYQTDTVSGKTGGGAHGYSVGTVGIKSLAVYVEGNDEAHFTQYDTVVGGSYDSSRGTYDLRALPFFKEWSTRPGMFKDARLSYGHDSGATVDVVPVLIQIADGCKRSFVTGGKKKWKGQGVDATTPDAVVNETYQFSFGDTWYGYQHSRGNYCDHPDRPGSKSAQRDQEVTGRTLKWKNAFPLRDGYPPGVANTGKRIDLWNEYRKVSKKTPEMNQEKIAQDPTQLRGRPSDRFYNPGSDSRPRADLSKINVTTVALQSTYTRAASYIVGSQNLTLANLQGKVPDVVFKNSAVYQEPPQGNMRTRSMYLLINDSVPQYEVEAYLHDSDEPKEEWINTPPPSSLPPGYRGPNITFTSARVPGDYALELLVYCPDRSCQPVHAMVPFHIPSRLDLHSIGPYHNTTEITAANAREDHDYYEFSLGKAERISHARVRNGPGLTLTLQDENFTDLQTVKNGGVIDTNTETTGTYYLEVSGDGVTDQYTLNLTTQYVSQKYEENDRKAAAYNLDPVIGVNDPQQQLQKKRGNNRWCRPTGGSNTGSNKAGPSGNTGNVNLGGSTICHRHDWWEILRTPTGYSPSDPDWYSVTLDRNERLEVNVTDDRLGVEFIHSGRTVAKLPANSSKTTLKHITTSPGTYYINITGGNVARHFLKVRWIRTAGLDRLEANDKRTTATRVSAPVGNNTTEYDFLRLAGGDIDYFQVTLQPGDTLNASLTHLKSPGTINLNVVAPNGNLTRATRPPGQQFSGGVREMHANLTARQSGIYYVKVNASGRVALMYNLTIQTEKSKRIPGPRLDGTRHRYEFEEVEVGTWHRRDVPTPEEIAKAIRFREIGVKPDEPVDRFEMAVGLRREPPEGVPPLDRALADEAPNYLVVNHEERFEGSARVRVEVSRETLAERDVGPDAVSVYRHPGPGDGDEWEELETSVADESDDRVVFEAESEGLSVYAVGVASRDEPAEGPAEPAEPTTTTDGDGAPEEVTETTDTEAPGLGLAVAIVALLAAMLVAVRRGA